MFSDKYYSAKVLSLILLIFTACFYSQHKYREFSLQDCLSNPEHGDGVTLKFGGNSKAGEVSEDRFELVRGKDKMTVMGRVGDLKKNDYIVMKAIFHKEGYLELKDIHVRKLRRLKIYLSVLPVFLVVGLILRQYKFDLKKRVLVER